MKCIECHKKADVIFEGNSYCLKDLKILKKMRIEMMRVKLGLPYNSSRIQHELDKLI